MKGQLALKVKLLEPAALAPTCAHPGKDLGFDLYALEDTLLPQGVPVLVRTGVAIEMEGFGFLMRDRSSMAKRGITLSGGTMDLGFTGEWTVILTFNDKDYSRPQTFTCSDGFELLGTTKSYQIKKGNRIAQFVPVRPETDVPVCIVDELTPSARGANGYGSTGK